ncbi:MAG TPA: nucleotide sugar dehydrogenase [Actinocrinis sp.]|nr:nucleotide sugar dehydrogenase [Actinocrinis sp.]
MTARKLTVVGQGYVGLPLAMRAVEVGYDVVGIDVDEHRVKRLAMGESYIEDVTSTRLAAALATGRYRPCCGYEEAGDFDVCVISVPTPLRDGVPDLTFVESAARSVGGRLKRGGTVILESTTYPGTTQEVVGALLSAESGLKAPGDFHLGFSPERIDPGNRRWHLQNTPKIVSGIDAASLVKVRAFYDELVDITVPVSSPRTAELAKLLENTFRQVNIALVNELAIAARQLGVDVWETIDAASTKPFGFMRFEPGPGVGGHCLPVDPSYLAWHVKRTLGQSFRFIELANDVNNHMPQYIVRRLFEGLSRRAKPLAGANLLLLGLAYKRDTGDVRESPALAVGQQLAALGARIRAVEPFAQSDHIPCEIPLVELTREELRAADAVVVLTDHSNFDYLLIEEAATYIFDTRNRCVGGHVEVL